jgi:vancomycin resistance protein YoaR
MRREELIRPTRARRKFPKREAQRRLQQKESKWAPIAYGVFVGAILVIFCVAYVTYAFSKYRGEILPGVQLDNVSLSGLTVNQAARLIDNQEAAIGRSPVRLEYGPDSGLYAWVPTQAQIGFYYRPVVTAKEAMNVGRTGNILSQLIDRLPIHPSHDVRLAYALVPGKLGAYLQTQVENNKIHRPTINAQIVGPSGGAFHLQPAVDGLDLDIPATEATVRSILRSLTKQTRTLTVIHTHPAITNDDALRVLGPVNRFLARTPVFGVGKRVFGSQPGPFAHMISFSEPPRKGHPTIVMNVDSSSIQTYAANLATQIDRPAHSPTFNFFGGQITVVRARQTGRTLDQTDAYRQILKAVTSLTPRARIHLKVAVTQPPLDTSNPASLGITTLLGEGTTSFPHAGSTRLGDITAVAKALNNTLIAPKEDISFNTLVGTSWANRMYDDRERSLNGQLVPGNHGALQQVATTFFRAMYQSGLQVEERHGHPYRLGWYEPPVGLDAIVNPGRGLDLRFVNSAHTYLLIETRVEPIRQQMYIYVYGPRLGWKVSLGAGTIVSTTPHGPAIKRHDPTLAPGAVLQSAWPHDGATTVVQRTIQFSKGHAVSDKITTTYQPWQAIISVGLSPTPQPTPTPTPTPSPTPSH